VAAVDDPTEAFAHLVGTAGDSVPLDVALLLVAAHALPDLDVDAELRRLDDLAAGVPEATFDGLCRHLVDDLGFRGDRTTYHDPANSLLPSVLQRRRGIPLSLAVVAMELGRRRGVPVLGIGLPGHFLIRSIDDAAPLVDLFDGGAQLDRAGARGLFERLHPAAAWDDAHLEPARPTAIVARVLANLANAYRRSGDRRGLCWALDLRLRLPGATDRERREAAIVLGAAGRYAEAAAVLEATGAERDRISARRLRARLN